MKQDLLMGLPSPIVEVHYPQVQVRVFSDRVQVQLKQSLIVED